MIYLINFFCPVIFIALVEERYASSDKGETSEGNKHSDKCQDTKIGEGS
jgi:hypothetical protein